MDKMKANLFKKAQNHDLNVEDIIVISSSRNPDVSSALQEIKEKLKWSRNSIEHENGSITPPMGLWVDVACEFIDNGYEGLIEVARSEEQMRFSVAFLKEYKSIDSVNSLLKISEFYMVKPHQHKDSIMKIVSGLNLLLSFKGSPVINDLISDKVRKLIHQSLALCESQGDYATVICALRGVGNEDSIKLVSGIPKLVGAWAGTEKIVKIAIRKRLKKV